MSCNCMTCTSQQECRSILELHTLLHCIFRHFDVRPDIDRKLWNLSCDIAVENILQELHLPDMKIPEESGQFEFLSLLAGRRNLLSAEKIYHFFIEEVFTENSAAQKSDIDLPLTEQLFYGDDHSFWYQQTTDKPKILKKNPSMPKSLKISM